MEKYTKSPLGLIPYKFWILQRIQSITNAIERYTEVGKEVPTEWVQEYNAHVKYVNEEE